MQSTSNISVKSKRQVTIDGKPAPLVKKISKYGSGSRKLKSQVAIDELRKEYADICKSLNHSDHGVLKMVCLCGGNCSFDTSSIRKHIETERHQVWKAETAKQPTMAQSMASVQAAVCKREREQELALIAMQVNLSMDALVYMLKETNLIRLVSGCNPFYFSSANTFRDRAMDEFLRQKSLLRGKLVGQYFSLAIDETKRYSNRAVVGIVAKTFFGTFLVDVVDTDELGVRLTADGYGLLITRFLQGSSTDADKLYSWQVTEVMADNCPAMMKLKGMLRQLNLVNAIPGNCISHRISLVEEHVFN